LTEPLSIDGHAQRSRWKSLDRDVREGARLFARDRDRKREPVTDLIPNLAPETASVSGAGIAGCGIGRAADCDGEELHRQREAES
jgi:hypothetical protein